MPKSKSRFSTSLLIAAALLGFPTYVIAQTTSVTGANGHEIETAGILSAKVIDQLDTFLVQHNALDGTEPLSYAPGLVLLVDTPSGQYLSAIGVQSLETQTELKANDVFEIGSNTKSFTIVLLMQLEEQGVLSLDQHLGDWLPEWAAKIPFGEEMTLAQLAGHTAGIWDYGDPIITRAVESPEYLRGYFSTEQLVQYAIEHGSPDFKPGAEGRWQYSNTGYILLGMVIEKAAGASLEELYQTHIFDPLSMQSAKYLTRSPEIGEIVDGYYWIDADHRVNTTYWNVSQGGAAGGLIMTAEDLLTYGKALAAGALFENDATLQAMLTFNPNGEGGLMPYGLGLIDFSLIGATGYWGHEGQTAGFQSLWLTNPELGITIVGLSNSANFSGFSFLEVAKILDQ